MWGTSNGDPQIFFVENSENYYETHLTTTYNIYYKDKEEQNFNILGLKWVYVHWKKNLSFSRRPLF